MPRRGENIYKRKDGRWEGRYIKGYINGKASYAYVYAKSYSEVKEKIKAHKESHDRKPLRKNKDYQMLFKQVCQEWLSSIKPQLKYSSFVKYTNIVNLYLLPCFSGRIIETIYRSDVISFANALLEKGGEKSEGLSVKTVNDILSTLRSIFEYAGRDLELRVADIHGVTIRSSVSQLRVLSRNEQKRLEEYIYANPDLCNYGILLCLYTGLRIGELCALKWEDISLKDRVLNVNKTMQRTQKLTDKENDRTAIMITPPKSACSVRRIPIPKNIAALLENIQAPDKAFFLTGKPDRYIEPRTMQNRFKRVLSLSNITEVNFHVLRHTFATRCIEIGFDIKSLSEILGHANVNITLNRYVHPSMELKEQNMDKLADLFAVR